MSKIDNKWIWPFELLEKIGEGGMGVVYRARYVKNDRQVAVKILPEAVTDEIVLGRFDRELEILRKLRHPNIVHSFGGTTEGAHRFYAMEVVEGGSFDKLLEKRGPLPCELAVKYFQQMAAALAYAHSHGVTHRDVKPGNFLIASNGQLKLSDFGLATFTSAQNLTAAGKTMGTFRYMPPEQIRGKNVSGQSDLYSLGCVMYEVLTGKPPFDGKSPAEILDQHLHKPAPRVSSIALDCPSDLDELISSLLEKDASQRPANAEIVLQKLENISPVKMVTISPTEDVRDVRTTAVADIPRPSKPAMTVWTLPSWLVMGIIAMPLILMGWGLQIRDKSQAAEVALESWVSVWESPDENMRSKAAVSLGRIGRYDPEILDLLAEGLKSDDSIMRQNALEGLAAAGGFASHYDRDVMLLQRDDPEPQVRYQAGKTLEAMYEDSNAPSLLVRLTLLAGIGIAIYTVYIIVRKRFT